MRDKIKILYVDHEIHNLNAFKAIFRIEYEILLCQSPKEGVEILKNNNIHIVIADQSKPTMIGIEFLKESGNRNREPVKVVVTAHRNIQLIEYAFKKGLIFGYHEKPWILKELKRTIENACKAYEE